MAIVQDLSYYKPQKIEEALELLAQHRESAAVLAGGTDLVNNIKEEQSAAQVIIDIKGLKELTRIDFTNNSLRIGALVTFSDLIESELIKTRFPLIAETAASVASVGIRNRATIMGNLCSAVPSLDSAPMLLLYDAEITVRNRQGARTIPITKWFLGPKKSALASDELALFLTVPLPERKHHGRYLKLGRYRGEDLAQAGTAVMAFDNHEYRIAFCAVGPVPQRARQIEALLKGQALTNQLIRQIQALVPNQISPLTDIRASREYRTHMVKVMLERGLKAAVAGLTGEKPQDILGG